jgi:6-phosphogluconolactonase
LTKKTGKLTEATSPFIMVKAGAGPRHLTFHPNNKYAYLVEELTGTISAYITRMALLLCSKMLLLFHPITHGINWQCRYHVSADGKFLYASNRGESNTIATTRSIKKNGSIHWWVISLLLAKLHAISILIPLVIFTRGLIKIATTSSSLK